MPCKANIKVIIKAGPCHKHLAGTIFLAGAAVEPDRTLETVFLKVISKGKRGACGTCAKECPLSAISVYRGCWAQVNEETCVGCGRCAKVCPADCITIVEREGQA